MKTEYEHIDGHIAELGLCALSCIKRYKETMEAEIDFNHPKRNQANYKQPQEEAQQLLQMKK
jgi:hypothetical protein